MDKLEKFKTENESNDAVVDDVAAKAYIENFAMDTFNRADEAQRANKVTKQTADTFMAAATFLDLLSIWGEQDREISAKSKFAKYHAARILKAFKAGEDPNATNPVVEQPLEPAEEGIDAELQDMETQQNGLDGNAYQPATVENVDDSGLPSVSRSALQGEASAPPPLPQRAPNDIASPSMPHQDDHQISPIEPPESTVARQNSAGGGYFPTVPSVSGDVDMMDSSQAPLQSPQQPVNPQDFYNTAAPPPTAPSPGSLGISSPSRPHRPPPDQMAAQPPSVPYVQSPPVPQMHAQPSPIAPAPVQPIIQQAPPTGGYRTDDEANMAAQKHAKWAVSALNFEDVNTAVKELRLALQSLGAG